MLNLEHFNKYKHPFKESFNNLKRIIKSYVKYFTIGSNDGVYPPSDYKVVFEDFFSEIDKEKYHISQPWGDFHPNHLHQYHGKTDEFVYLTSEGLNLGIKNEPKTFVKKDLYEWQQAPQLPEEFTIPVGIGLVVTKQSWQYGWFESWIKLPEGIYYWPAFWLSGANSWPPEIDIFEAYSDESAKYGKRMLRDLIIKDDWKIQPNIHYGNVEQGTKKQYGSYNVPIKFVTERFVQYICHWEKDFIRIYYDGVLVLECTNPDVLKWFNEEKSQMNIILNQGFMDEKDAHIVQENPMIVKSLRVLQKK